MPVRAWNHLANPVLWFHRRHVAMAKWPWWANFAWSSESYVEIIVIYKLRQSLLFFLWYQFSSYNLYIVIIATQLGVLKSFFMVWERSNLAHLQLLTIRVCVHHKIYLQSLIYIPPLEMQISTFEPPHAKRALRDVISIKLFIFQFFKSPSFEDLLWNFELNSRQN